MRYCGHIVSFCDIAVYSQKMGPRKTASPTDLDRPCAASGWRGVDPDRPAGRPVMTGIGGDGAPRHAAIAFGVKSRSLGKDECCARATPAQKTCFGFGAGV